MPASDFMKMWDFRDPQGTETRLQGALAEARAGGDASLEAEILTQIARTQGLRGLTTDAHATLDQAAALARPEMVRARVRILLERGRATNGLPGAKDEGAAARRAASRPHFRAAYELASTSGEHGLAMDAAHMMGIVEEPDEALAWNRKAIAFAEASTQEDARKWLGTLYNNTGWTLFERGDFAGALALFEKDVAFRTERKQVDPARIARWSRAKALRRLGRVEEALAAQRELEAEREAAGAPDGYVFEELGECLLALGRGDEARPHFARAAELLGADAWFVEHEAPRLRRLREIGGVAIPEPDGDR